MLQPFSEARIPETLDPKPLHPTTTVNAEPQTLILIPSPSGGRAPPFRSFGQAACLPRAGERSAARACATCICEDLGALFRVLGSRVQGLGV